MKKSSTVWTTSVERSIPEYNAETDVHCVTFFERKKRKQKSRKRVNKNGTKRNRSDTKIIFLNGAKQITTQLLPQDSKGIEIEIIQRILKREAQLQELYEVVCSQENKGVLEFQIKKVIKSLKLFVITTVQVAECISSWRKEIGEPREFIFNDTNYLIKMIKDLDFLDEYPKFLQRFRKWSEFKDNFSFKRNPLITEDGLPSCHSYSPKLLTKQSQYVFSRQDFDKVSKPQGTKLNMVLEEHRKHAVQQMILLEELLHNVQTHTNPITNAVSTDKGNKAAIISLNKGDIERPSSSGLLSHNHKISLHKNNYRPHTSNSSIGIAPHSNIWFSKHEPSNWSSPLQHTKPSTRLQAMDLDISRSKRVIDDLKERIKLRSLKPKPAKVLRRVEKNRGVGWQPLERRQMKNRHHIYADTAREKAGIKNRISFARMMDVDALKQELELREAELQRKEMAKYNYIQRRANMYSEEIAAQVRESFEASKLEPIKWSLIDIETRLNLQEKPSPNAAATYIQKNYRGTIGRKLARKRKNEIKERISKKISHDVVSRTFIVAISCYLEQYWNTKLEAVKTVLSRHPELEEEARKIAQIEAHTNQLLARTATVHREEIRKINEFNKAKHWMSEKASRKEIKRISAETKIELDRINGENEKAIQAVNKEKDEEIESIIEVKQKELPLLNMNHQRQINTIEVGKEKLEHVRKEVDKELQRSQGELTSMKSNAKQDTDAIDRSTQTDTNITS